MAILLGIARCLICTITQNLGMKSEISKLHWDRWSRLPLKYALILRPCCPLFLYSNKYACEFSVPFFLLKLPALHQRRLEKNASHSWLLLDMWIGINAPKVPLKPQNQRLVPKRKLQISPWFSICFWFRSNSINYPFPSAQNILYLSLFKLRQF